MTSHADQEAGRTAALPVIPKHAAPLRREVVDALRMSIVHGRLAPGARLVERELIDMTGVSRTVIRESLRQLESEGLVDVVPNKGAVVRKLTQAEARDLYAIRAVLEGLAARMFVRKADETQLAELRKELEATVTAYREAPPEKIIEIKTRFYDVLFNGARSETLSTMIGALHARIWRWRALGLSHPKRSSGRSEESIATLQALYAAIEKRDEELAEKIARDEVTKAATEAMEILAREE